MPITFIILSGITVVVIGTICVLTYISKPYEEGMENM